MDRLVFERIDEWEAAGVVDAETAARLRAVETARSPSERAASARTAPNRAASFFGPAVSLVEMFAYVGGGFLLAGWGVLIGRLIGGAGRATGAWLTVGAMAVPAAVFFGLGIALLGRSDRAARAAGVAFVLSTVFIAAGVQANLAILSAFGVWIPAIAAAIGLLAAIGYRWLHPSLLTQFGLLTMATYLVAAWLEAASFLVNPASDLLVFGFDRNSALALAILSAASWSGMAAAIGLLGVAEARAGSTPADRRAAITRFWAGVVLVGGIAYAVMRTYYDESRDVTVRVLPPWVGVLLVLGVSAILVERAFRREAGAYVFAAALGLIIALSDLNASYVFPAGGTEIALLLEGLLLLAAAFAAERLSRRIGRDEPPVPAPPVAADEDRVSAPTPPGESPG